MQADGSLAVPAEACPTPVGPASGAGAAAPPAGHAAWVAPCLPTAAALALALEQPGCPVCRLVGDAQDGFFRRLAAGDVPTDLAAAVARAGGFCFAHGWEAVERLPGPVLAALLGEALAACRARLEPLRVAAAGPPTDLRARRALRAARTALASAERCPPCTLTAAVEVASGALLIAVLRQPAGQALYRAGAGLCVRHARPLLATAPGEVLPLLIERLAAPLRALLEDIALYYHKETWEYAHEPKGTEQDAWRRGIARWAGERRAAGNMEG
jgi:hypothetical protein